MTDYNYTRPRRPVAAEISGPGPGYSLPGLVGWSNHDPRSIYSRAPAYHIGLRYNPPPDEGGPGPGLYNSNTKLYRTGKENPPAYTICGKRKEDTRDLSPGPTDYACHLIHHVASKHFRPPAYSFGSSFRTWTPDQTPGIVTTLNFINISISIKRIVCLCLCLCLSVSMHSHSFQDTVLKLCR